MQQLIWDALEKIEQQLKTGDATLTTDQLEFLTSLLKGQYAEEDKADALEYLAYTNNESELISQIASSPGPLQKLAIGWINDPNYCKARLQREWKF